MFQPAQTPRSAKQSPAARNPFLRYCAIFLLFALISFLVLLPELLAGGGSTLLGSDTFFHLSRYTDAARQLQTGHFSYFQQFFTGDHSGRIVNALYGPLIAYLQGFLLLLTGFSGPLWALFSNWLLNLLGMTCMAYLLHENAVPFRFSVLLSTLFILTGNVSVQSSSGTYAVGYALLPLVIAAAIRLLKNKQTPVKIWELTLSITLLAQSHMLSLLLGLLFYALAALFYLFTHSRSDIFRTLKKILLAAALTLLLTANVWAGYLDVTHSTPLVSPFAPPTLIPLPTLSLSLFGYTRFSTSAFVLAQAALIYLLIKKWREPWLWFAALTFEIFSAIAIGWLPLNAVPGITTFQFDFRFMALAFPVSLLLIGVALTQLAHRGVARTCYALLALATLLTLIPYTTQTVDNAKSFAALPSSKALVRGLPADTYYQLMQEPKKLLSTSFYSHIVPNQGLSAADYVPNDSPFLQSERGTKNTANATTFSSYVFNDIFGQAHFSGKNLQRRVTNRGLLLIWKSTTAQQTTLPVIGYTHSQIWLNGQRLSPDQVQHSYIGAITVSAKKGQNTVRLFYQPSPWFLAAVTLQGLTIIVMILLSLRQLWQAHQKRPKMI